MKKLHLAALLILLAIPAFAQDTSPAGDEYAKFQGVWYGAIGEDKIFFIFIDDIFIYQADSTISCCKYSIEGQNIVAKQGRDLDGSEWMYATDEDDYMKIQYVFSGKRLVLIFDGEPVAFSKDYTDFPEWRYSLPIYLQLF